MIDRGACNIDSIAYMYLEIKLDIPLLSAPLSIDLHTSNNNTCRVSRVYNRAKLSI